MNNAQPLLLRFKKKINDPRTLVRYVKIQRNEKKHRHTRRARVIFFVNNKSLEVVNNACQSMVLPVRSVKSGK